MSSKARKFNCLICVQCVPGDEREKIYALGKCNHIVCYVCSARLRVICDQLECPTCRERLDVVIFTSMRKRSYEGYDVKDYVYNDKYGIYFENKSQEQAFKKLLKYECRLCLKIPSVTNASFEDVFGLKTHLDYAHRLKLCDLCLTHNKLFPFELSYYDAKQLQKHILEGEVNTSHRGHPRCRLCNDSFFNQDDLILHMSREHYYCHLCNHENERRYFNDYDGLRIHFKNEHFLCERDNCREERFTSVFANEIEYTIHIVHEHGPTAGTFGRAESRQLRTITVPGLPHIRPESSSYQGRQTNRRGDRHGGSSSTVSTNRQTRDFHDPRAVTSPVDVSIIQQRLPTSADFPTLDGGTGLNSAQSRISDSRAINDNQLANNSRGGLSNVNNVPTTNQRPSTSSGSSTLSQRVASGPSRNSFLRTASGTYGRAPRLDEQDFPPLPEAPKPTYTAKKGTKEKSSKKSNNVSVDGRNGFPTLDQLLSASLAEAAQQQETNSNVKNSSRQKNGNNKNHKQKPIKIQLS